MLNRLAKVGVFLNLVVILFLTVVVGFFSYLLAFEIQSIVARSFVSLCIIIYFICKYIAIKYMEKNFNGAVLESWEM